MEKLRGNLTWLSLGGVVAVLPFLILVFFWHPLGVHGIDWASNWGEQFTGVSWLEQQAYWYTTTMGRYSSTALMSTTSYWYSLWAARLLILFIHLGVGVAVWWLIKKIFTEISTAASSGVAVIILAIFVLQLSNPFDTLYRFSGLLTYTTGLMSLLVGIALGLEKKWWGMIPVIFFTVGTNEIALVQCGLLFGVALFLLPVIRKETGGVLVLVASLVGAAFALGAPGNWVRATSYENETGLIELALLTVATSSYTWLAWLGGTLLIPILILVQPHLPTLTVSRKMRVGILLLIVLWLPVSLLPVIIATRGDSLPEGIVDWQIIPIIILLLSFMATLPKFNVKPRVKWLLTAFVISSFFFQGLGIDRSRSRGYVSPVNRIQVTSLASNAWIQLVSGKVTRYSNSIDRQYEAIKKCRGDTCHIPPIMAAENNFLYDKIYDRRSSIGGDPFLCYLFGCEGKAVKTQTLKE